MIFKNLINWYKSYPRSTRLWSNLFILTSILLFFIDFNIALIFQTVFTVVLIVIALNHEGLIENNYAYLGLIITYILFLLLLLSKIPGYIYRNYIKKFNEYIDNL